MATKSTTRKKLTKKRSKRTKTSPAQRRSTATAAGPLEQLSMRQIEAQLEARRRGVVKLERKRERLQNQIAEIEAELASLVGRAPSNGKRPGNESNLGDALAGVLSGKQMSVTEAEKAVRDAGYMTTAQNFRTIVNQKLISDKRFKKVQRGVYTCKA